MNEFVEQVREFQAKFDPKHNMEFPYALENAYDLGEAVKVLELRRKLIKEEVDELCEAVNSLLFCLEDARDKHVSVNRWLEYAKKEHWEDWHDAKMELADALGDILVVTIGTAIALGFDIEKIMKRIHASNMSKLGADGKPIYRKDGKVLKGPDYFPPYLGDLV